MTGSVRSWQPSRYLRGCTLTFTCRTLGDLPGTLRKGPAYRRAAAPRPPDALHRPGADRPDWRQPGPQGGTALLLAYGLPRFSVDLDFDGRRPAGDLLCSRRAVG
ncbi:nucleotidyl transferase AbiEii/AbiGii toxin family protein [Actinomyces naeslundii]|uniref:nucleotidyl transferase AbiEii/AbiGii toxin family protein n=1 Tax=Actinomyces naeslundii TaxID=1655 RepID=UPI0028ED676B|nr:nucleotidyl transferase AbiEii/AbiGii toxin family protein [Actinomyces naeslundii]